MTVPATDDISNHSLHHGAASTTNVILLDQLDHHQGGLNDTHQESSLPLDSIRQLTDVNQIKAQLRILNQQESQVDSQLDTFLQNQHDIQTTLESLDSLK